MTPAEFARDIVIPTLEDFRADRTSRRWAYLSAVAVYHLRDYLAEALAAERAPPSRAATKPEVEGAARSVDRDMRAALPSGAFDTVRGVANGSKHGITRQPHAVPFTAGTDWARPPMRAGVGQCGLSQAGDGVGGREFPHDGRRLDIYNAVQAVFLAFVAAFPAQLDGCSFDPFPEVRAP